MIVGVDVSTLYRVSLKMAKVPECVAAKKSGFTQPIIVGV